jgi:hypothetical protein
MDNKSMECQLKIIDYCHCTKSVINNQPINKTSFGDTDVRALNLKVGELKS